MYISGELTDADARALCMRTVYWGPKWEEDGVNHELVLNCTGGAPYLTLAVANALVEYPGPLTTYASGYCVGAGVLLLACGTHRAAHPAARFLVQGMLETEELETIPNPDGEPLPPPRVSEAQWYNTWHDQFLKRQTTEPAATWGFLRESGLSWFGADDALAWGLIHEVRNWRID